jgi:hypothetical protein
LDPIGCIIIVCGGGRWSQGVHKRKWCDTDIDTVILTHLLFFLGVTDDDNIAVIGRP